MKGTIVQHKAFGDGTVLDETGSSWVISFGKDVKKISKGVGREYLKILGSTKEKLEPTSFEKILEKTKHSRKRKKPK